MSTERILPGISWPIRFFAYDGVQPVYLGKTIIVVIQRLSDNMYWDGTAFSASFSTNTMSELSGNIFLDGVYEYSFNVPAGDESYDWSVKFDNGGAIVPPLYARGRIEATGAATATNIWDSITATAMDKIADTVLRRHLANARVSSDGDSLDKRSIIGAVSKLVNNFQANSVSGKLEIYEEDDITIFFEQTMGTDSSAIPIVGADTI